ncbi:acetyltransferase [Roseibium sp. TrichSKD4]|uniref:GNAT family N-acetyltransferase n=1 Tax=Roseibium sp. TrichSKD4 TaxID=744980 RepID=UPI0001E56FA5|nr:GNAT family protein [Roseibium sp. TrichSKD4]EFO32270.1 acetyltransferase [Roseibium sp. TrichSKD4]
MLAFAAEKLKLTAVPAYTHPENNRSGQLLKKLGFLHVGQIAWTSTGDTAERYEWHAA